MVPGFKAAQILFEKEGYHGMFLSQIEGFIRRKTTYSPKISEELIPVIFRVALAKKMPMTKFVKHILRDYLRKTTKQSIANSEKGGFL